MRHNDHLLLWEAERRHPSLWRCIKSAILIAFGTAIVFLALWGALWL